MDNKVLSNHNPAPRAEEHMMTTKISFDIESDIESDFCFTF
jgi:hypothetical protein